MNTALRSWVTAGVAIVGAGVVAVTPAVTPSPRLPMAAVLLTSTEPDIVIDFVRHAETYPPGNVIAVASNGLPGFPLSGMPGQPPIDPADNGELQANAVGNTLATEFGTPTGTLSDGSAVPVGGVEGIFGGYEQRMIETAQQFLTNEGFSYTPNAAYGAISPGYTPLDGFDEIGGGIYAHDPPGSLGVYLSELTGLGWAFGLRLLPLPGSNDSNGVVLDENFGGAVNTAYTDAINDPNPVISADGQLTDVVFSGEGAIVAWTVMNVKNPDLAILLPLALNGAAGANLLPTTGQVVIEGNPTDGWTMESFGGVAIPADPGLITELFVDVRNVITAPQNALWDLSQALLTSDWSNIWTVLETGLQNVGTALVQFPGALFNDISNAVQTFGADLAAGESFTDVFNSVILGLPA